MKLRGTLASCAVKPDKKFNEAMKASWDLLLRANPVVVRSVSVSGFERGTVGAR
jgi:hypothetical protein